MNLRNLVFSPLINLWYNHISKIDHKGEVLFLNYGYSDGEEIGLHEEDELNRYCIQLYHNTVKGVDLTNKKILEIGCGKGGGASYISRYCEPDFIIGLDRSKEEIKFNNRHYQDKKLSFKKGDALEIPFPENSFDVILNVESSHAYLNFNKFLSEVKRVLKPGGYLLFTDLRLKNKIQAMFLSFENSGMKIIGKKDITDNIIQSLDLDLDRRMGLIKRMLPKFLHQWGRSFSGIKGTGMYESFKNGGRKYYSYVLRN